MKLKQTGQDILRFFGYHLLYRVLFILCKTLRVEKINSGSIEIIKAENKKCVLAFWHGTMLLPWYLHGDPGTVALISKSRDGDLLAKLLKVWKYKVVRGSSSSGGDVALGIMVDYAKNSYSVAITPDGPRGPRHKFKAGAVITAKRAKLPLLLVGVGFKQKKILKNWDEFEIPYFFSKAKVVYSDPILIDGNLDYDQTSGMISLCEEKLNKLQLEAQKF